MTFIRDLISIAVRVHQGDFVLKLSEGVSQADQTRELGYTLADFRGWKPTVSAARRGRKKKS